MKSVFKIQFIFLFLLTLFSCEKEMDKYYERPDFLKGSAYVLLQERGNFKLFLQAADRAGYSGMLKGRGLCTVMAPNDDAFSAYMKKHNYASVEDIPVAELKVLIPYHIIQNAYEEEYMLGFTMANDGITVGNGTAYKFKTFSQAPNVTMLDPISKENKRILNREKYIPVVSTRFFKTKKCTDFAGNYKYFFPEVNWQGDDEKLHACNAAVIEAGLPSDNGYVYILDKVVEPVRTVYEAIQKPLDNDYSLFLSMYDRFAEVTPRSTDDSLFYYNHLRTANKKKTLQFADELPNLRSEWGYHKEMDGMRPFYYMYMTHAYNCFTPNNTVLKDYFNTNFPEFKNIEDIPQLTLYYFLKNFVRESQELIWPEMFERDGIRGVMGEKWTLNRSNITTREFCANGVFYGMDKVFTPMLFDIVTQPLFTSPNYEITANMFFHSDQFVTLTDPTPDRFTLFVQSDAVLAEDYLLVLDKGGPYFNDKDEKIKKDGEALANDKLLAMAESHIIHGAIKKFDKRAFYATKSPYTYVYTDGGFICGENGGKYEVVKSWNTLNGPTYEITGRFEKNTIKMVDYLKDSYKDFYDLLRKAELILTDSKTKMDYFPFLTAEERLVIFAPKNGTLDKAALSALPKAELAAKLSYYFVSMRVNMRNDYILPNYAGSEGAMITVQEDPENSTIYKKEYYKMNIHFQDETRLKLVNHNGSAEISTDGEVPFFATDGLVYGIAGEIQAK